MRALVDWAPLRGAADTLAKDIASLDARVRSLEAAPLPQWTQPKAEIPDAAQLSAEEKLMRLLSDPQIGELIRLHLDRMGAT